MSPTEECLARIEGGYEHRATKADIAELTGMMNTLAGELRVHKWVLGLLFVLQLLILGRVFEIIPLGG